MYACTVTSPRHTSVSQATLRRLYAEFAGVCAIADYPYPNKLPDGTPTLQIAHITSATPGGVRYGPSVPAAAAND